jgi:hypothetical protein
MDNPLGSLISFLIVLRSGGWSHDMRAARSTGCGTWGHWGFTREGALVSGSVARAAKKGDDGKGMLGSRAIGPACLSAPIDITCSARVV